MNDRVSVMDGGSPQVYLLAATLGNVITTINAPVDRKHLFQSLLIQLDTDATVANRQIEVRITSSPLTVEPLGIGWRGGVIAASSVGQMALAHSGLIANITTFPAAYGDWGDDIWLDEAIGIQISILVGQAGDSYQAWGRYKDYPL